MGARQPFLGARGAPRQVAPDGSSASPITQSGDQGECAGATPNLMLALPVMALAAALPCVPAILSISGALWMPPSVSVWLGLFGGIAITVKWLSIVYGLGRYST